MRKSIVVLGAMALVAAATVPGGVAMADEPATLTQSNAQIFDARADGAASSFSIDIPAVLVGQQITGGFISSSITATSDPRGFALAGLAPVPKASSIPLLIPGQVPQTEIPVPQNVQDGLKEIRFESIPTQCQASFPPITAGDNDRTCGGPTFGDSALGFIASAANARVLSTGSQADPLATRTIGAARVTSAELRGLQSVFENVTATAEGGVNDAGDPASISEVHIGEVRVVSGLFSVTDIVSRTLVSFNGNKESTAANTSFSFGGATFAGVPVRITTEGLTLATEKMPADQVRMFADQLNMALENNDGFSAKLLPAPPIDIRDNLVRAESGGILVTFRGTTANFGADVTFSQIFGTSSAQVSAVANSANSATATTPAASGADAATTDAAGAPAAVSADSSTAAGDSLATVGDAGAIPSFDAGTTPAGDVAAGTVPDAALDIVAPVTTDNGTGAQAGDQALLAGFTNPSPLSQSQIKSMYPLFALLVLGALAATRLRRIPFRS